MKKEPVIFILALISAVWIFYSLSFKEKSQQSEFKNFSWMEGEWTYKKDSVFIYENWEARGGSIMEGNSFTLVNGDTVEKEELRIIKLNLDYFYIAKPIRRNPILFEMKLDTSKTVEFINEQNEFPSLIRYRGYEDSLRVTLKGKSQIISYTMRK